MGQFASALFVGLGATSSVLSGVAAVREGQMKAQQLKAQAYDIQQNAISDRIQGLRAETEYGRKLVDALARTRVAAAAGGVSADTGTAGSMFNATAREGDEGLSLARTQGQVRLGFADLARRRAMRMASAARTSGYIEGAGRIIGGLSQLGGIGGPSGAGAGG